MTRLVSPISLLLVVLIAGCSASRSGSCPDPDDHLDPLPSWPDYEQVASVIRAEAARRIDSAFPGSSPSLCFKLLRWSEWIHSDHSAVPPALWIQTVIFGGTFTDRTGRRRYLITEYYRHPNERRNFWKPAVILGMRYPDRSPWSGVALAESIRDSSDVIKRTHWKMDGHCLLADGIRDRTWRAMFGFAPPAADSSSILR